MNGDEMYCRKLYDAVDGVFPFDQQKKSVTSSHQDWNSVDSFSHQHHQESSKLMWPF